MAGKLQQGSLLAAAQQMAADGGWRCLFRGNGVNVMRSAPQKALDFFAFDLFKRKLGEPAFAFARRRRASCQLPPGGADQRRSRPPTCRERRLRCPAPPCSGAAGQLLRRRPPGGNPLNRRSASPAGSQRRQPTPTANALPSPPPLPPHRPAGEDSPANTLVAAGLAGTVSWLTLYPLEVLRSRMAVEACAEACATQSSPHALFRAILAAEGWRALYRGLGPSVAAIFPEAAITYGLHDLLKRAYRRLNRGREPGVGPSLAFGVLSAFTGQTVAYPLETVSRRLQVQAAGGGATAVSVVRELLRQGGPRALYRGIGAASLRLVPMALVSFGTYEAVRSLLLQQEQVQQQQQQQQQQRQEAGAAAGRQCQPPEQQQQQQGEEEEQWCVVRSLEDAATPLQG
jgi:hypothetical protein